MSADEYARRGSVRSRVPARLSAARPLVVDALPLAAVLAAAGALFARGLGAAPSFDEGVYAAQTDALLHGQRLGSDVFAAQPPGFHWLLLVPARLGGVGLDQLRLAVLALALLGLVAAYVLGSALAGRAGGLAAAAILAVAPPYPSWAARISADLPGTVLALWALALVVSAPLAGRRRTLQLAGAGVLVAAAESVKLDAAILLLPVVVLAAARRLRWAELGILVAAALATLGVEAAVLAGSLPDVWRGAVSYHLAARSTEGFSESLHQLRAFFHPRQPFTWLVAAGLAATLALRPRPRLPIAALWATAGASAAFLAWHHPIRDNHMVLLSIALAVPVGVVLGTLGRSRGAAGLVAAAVVALAVLGGYVQESRRVDRNAQPLPAELRWAVDQVEAGSGPGDLVVSDEPAVPFLADRRMPGGVIDTAVLRFDSGYLSDAEVLAAVDAHDVPVVVAGRAFLQRPELLRGLERRFATVRERGGVRVYVRS